MKVKPNYLLFLKSFLVYKFTSLTARLNFSTTSPWSWSPEFGSMGDQKMTMPWWWRNPKVPNPKLEGKCVKAKGWEGNIWFPNAISVDVAIDLISPTPCSTLDGNSSSWLYPGELGWEKFLLTESFIEKGRFKGEFRKVSSLNATTAGIEWPWWNLNSSQQEFTCW